MENKENEIKTEKETESNELVLSNFNPVKHFGNKTINIYSTSVKNKKKKRLKLAKKSRKLNRK